MKGGKEHCLQDIRKKVLSRLIERLPHTGKSFA